MLTSRFASKNPSGSWRFSIMVTYYVPIRPIRSPHLRSMQLLPFEIAPERWLILQVSSRWREKSAMGKTWWTFLLVERTFPVYPYFSFQTPRRQTSLSFIPRLCSRLLQLSAVRVKWMIQLLKQSATHKQKCKNFCVWNFGRTCAV